MSVLIDSGVSSRGWSYYGKFARCPRLFAYEYKLDLALGDSDGFTRGSMTHTGLAHLYARWSIELHGRALVGTDEGLRELTSMSDLMLPEEAIEAWVAKHERGANYLDRIVTTLRAYRAAKPTPPPRIIGVEVELKGVLGFVAGRWGLWEGNGLSEALGIERTQADVTPLDCPGHPDHGQPIFITRRADLIVADEAGVVEIIDHKAHAHVSVARAKEEYVMEGGWAPFRILGRQLWGNRYSGRVLLNLVQTTKPYTIKEVAVPATPFRDAQFPAFLYRLAHEIAQAEVDLPDPWELKAVQSSCYGSYGLCDGASLCGFGPDAVADLHADDVPMLPPPRLVS